MMDIWSWICELSDSAQWAEEISSHVFELASVKTSSEDSICTIQLKAKRTVGSDLEALVTFSLFLEGFHSFGAPKTLWISDACPLNSEKPFLPLVLQLLQEIITRSPTAPTSTCPRSQLQTLKPEPIAWVMDSHSPESFSSFFNLVFLTRLFWLCACDSPAEVGSLYFKSLLGPSLGALSYTHTPVLRTFLVSVGADVELCFMRTVGYMLTKWLILREVGVGLQSLAHMPGQHVGFSYATEAHGHWVLKGYAPIWGMKLTSFRDNKFPLIEAEGSVLKYALAHQQLEAVIQLEYSVEFYEGYIQVNARVDNLRFHVAQLAYNTNDNVGYANEKHFVSRARVWIGPEVGATYVIGLSLNRSTDQGERELEMQRTFKGSFGKSKAPDVKTRARLTTRTRTKNWRWDQDVEGNAAIFDAVLCANTTGCEVATLKPFDNGDNGINSVRNRCNGPNRPFTKRGGLIFARDEYGEVVGWRLSKEMDGSVLKWRIGGQVWVSYRPNEMKSSYYETRCVEWCDEVDLPLIPGK